MDFKEKKAIYRQIAENLADQILLGEYQEGDKIHSVREMAVQAAVNPNTVMRAYEYLQRNQVIETKRGMGYFVSQEALTKIKALKREDFEQTDLPYFFKNIYLLDLDFKNIAKQYQNYIKQYTNTDENK